MKDTFVKGIIQKELKSGEKIIWSGKPMRPSYTFPAIMMCAISGLLLLIGLMVFVVMIASGSFGISLFMFVWTSIAGWNFYVGLRMISGPMKHVYAVTNQRALIVDTRGSTRRASFNPQSLSQMERTGNDEIGSIVFGTPQSDFMMFTMALNPPLNRFLNIENPKSIEDLLHKTFSKQGLAS